MFSTYKDGFKFKNDTSEKVYNTIFEQNGNIEYAMVSYNSYSPGKKALFFVSNNDIGVIATVRNFTNPKWLSSFGHQLPKSTQYFNALFEVSGIQRNDTNCKLVALEIVAP